MSSSVTVYEASPPRLVGRLAVEALKRLGIEADPLTVERSVGPTPSRDVGDFGVPIMRFARGRAKLGDLEKAVAEVLRAEDWAGLVEWARVVRGYLNVRYNAAKLAETVFRAVALEGDSFGFVKTGEPLRIVVEHTSANPVHPLHIGHARNASLGDTLARLLRARGHVVETRFYINDVGRQVAVLAYGVIRAGLEVPEGVKPDHWLGLVYAITHTLLDLEAVKKELRELRERGAEEEYREKLSEQDELAAVLAELRERDPELFDRIAEAVRNDPDPEKTLAEVMQRYEDGSDEELKARVRRVVELVLDGFRVTLSRLGVAFDKWDWESELTWTSMVRKFLEEAKRSPYFTVYKGAYALRLDAAAADPEVRERLGIPEGLEIPPLVLMRSDGTTLYTTRDVVYTLKKFREFNADKVVNVIAAEQRLEQLQVRLALITLGYRREGLNTIHYAYEMVNLPGASMSGRRGRYISLDELLDRAVALAYSEVAKREELSEEEKRRIAEAVGTAAVRYAMVSVSAMKPMTFNMEEALSFERNSAPYIQYTYARAHNILSKYGRPIDWEHIDYKAAEENEQRRELVIMAAEYPYVFVKAADEMRPELLVAYINRLADRFNTWYPRDHVIREPDEGKRNFKLALVYTVKTILGNTMDVLGVPRLEKM